MCMIIESGDYVALMLESIGWEAHGVVAMRCHVWTVVGRLFSHVAMLLDEMMSFACL